MWSAGDYMGLFAIMAAALAIFFVIFAVHRTKMKLLEIEALKIQKANLQAEVKHATEEEMSKMKDRVEVLEAIVTSKNYDLSERITRVK